MDLSRRTLVKAAVTGTVLTAGCGTNGDETEPGDDPGESETTGDEDPGAGGEDTPEETEPEEETETDGETETTGEGESAATVQVGSHPDFGEILVGPEEMTLYMFDQDTQDAGESACTDDCTTNWPPLTVEDGEPEAGDGVMAELSTFEREDGSMQVTANGWPLYHFANDEEPGDANGQGANDVWWVLGADGSPIQGDGTGTGTGTETVAGNETAAPNDGETDTETESS